MVKNQIRALGIDDAAFDLRRDLQTRLVGVVYRGRNFLEDVLSATIKIDGVDSTSKIIEMVRQSKFLEQLKVLFLSGITYGGFNTVDVTELNLSLHIPVIVILDKKPDLGKIEKAVSKLNSGGRIMDLIKKAGAVFETITEKGVLRFQTSGIDVEGAKEFITLFQLNSKIPEPLRAAQVIAKIFKPCNLSN